MTEPHVVAVNHKRRLALFSDDQLGTITNWWTNDQVCHEDPPPNPVSCIAQHPAGKWASVDLRRFERTTRH